MHIPAAEDVDDSMRTSVGKLTDQSKKPSGGAARILTDWDNWIMEILGYLERHIKRVDAGKRKRRWAAFPQFIGKKHINQQQRYH